MNSYRSGGSAGSDLTSPLHSPRINSPRSRRMVHPYPDALTSPPFHSTEPSYFSSTLRSSMNLGIQPPRSSTATGPISPSVGDQSPSVTLNFGQLSIASSSNSPTQIFPPPGPIPDPNSNHANAHGQVPPRVRSASLTRHFGQNQSSPQASPGFNRKGSAQLKRKAFVEPFAMDSEMPLVQDSPLSSSFPSSEENKSGGFSLLVPVPNGVGLQPQAPTSVMTAPPAAAPPISNPPPPARSTKTSRKGSADVKSLSPGRVANVSAHSASSLRKSASSVGLATMNLSSVSLSKSSIGASSSGTAGWSSSGDHSSGPTNDDDDSPPATGEDDEQKKGPWLPEEDAQLMSLVESHGPKDWSYIAQQMPGRIGKQCRERYFNHLAPDVRKEAWTPEEDEAIIRYHSTWGNKWTLIARVLSNGRPPNAIKNRWNSSLKKRAEADGIEQPRYGGSPPSPSALPPLPPPPAKKDKEKVKKERNNSQTLTPPQRRTRKPRNQTAVGAADQPQGAPPPQQQPQLQQMQQQQQAVQQNQQFVQQFHQVASPGSSSSAESAPATLEGTALFLDTQHPIGTLDPEHMTDFNASDVADGLHQPNMLGFSQSYSPALVVETGTASNGHSTLIGTSSSSSTGVHQADVAGQHQQASLQQQPLQQQQQQQQQQVIQQPINQFDMHGDLPPFLFNSDPPLWDDYSSEINDAALNISYL